MKRAEDDEHRIRLELATVTALSLHSLAVHRWLPSPLDDLLNLLTPVVAVAGAHREGLSWDELGLDPKKAVKGLAVGATAGTVALAAIAGAASVPAMQRFFNDERVTDVGTREALYHAMVRIPLATAASEEILFRGVLAGAIERRTTPRNAAIWSSALFGLWHILPTIRTHSRNSPQGVRPRPGASVLGFNIGATALAGATFLWLRRASGSLVAAIAAHAAINVSAFLVGRAVAERAASEGGNHPGETHRKARVEAPDPAIKS